jgi:hypothetical protein
VTTELGSDTVVILEIDVPFCSKTYGVTCSAALGVTGAIKCYQGIATCDVPLEYDPDVLTLRFARPQDGLLQYGNVFPCIDGDIDTTPAQINIASMVRNASPIGRREEINVTLDDFQWSDHLVDKYRLERRSGAASIPVVPFIPEQQGTFWGKFLARNPYFSNFNCRVREGFLGQPLDEMRVRNYVVYKIDGPTNGQVTLTAKDLFSFIEARKSVAPVASQGELLADLTGSPGTFTVTPTGIGDIDYASITAVTSGHVAIRDEVIEATRVGDVFTVVLRAALGTEADDHKAEDLVQLVLSYVTTRPHDIAYDLLVNYSSIPAASIPKATWDILAADITELYTGRITKPTPVLDLIGEICEQAGFTLWPDVSTGEVKFAALRPSAASVTVDDDEWILDKPAIVPKRQDKNRVSQMWVYYGQVNPSVNLDEERNFHSRYVTPDLEAEGPQQYGTPAIRQVFSRWIPQFGRTLAQGVGQRILAMFRDPPLEISLSIHASRDGQLQLARPFNLRIAESQSVTGALQDVLCVPIELERGENEIGVKAQQVTFSGGGSSGLGGNDRTIFLENDAFNLNLRTVHDSIFSVPTGVETVTFILVDGFTIGSTSTGAAAIRTGDWPVGVSLNFISHSLVQGRGGDGGSGSGSNGNVGGDAFLAEFAITIDNTDGEIWSGGGGGAAGAERFFLSGLGLPLTFGGGGGAAGAGTLGGNGGAGGAGNSGGSGSNGSAGTSLSGGAGGSGENSGTGTVGGDGGAGGGPGLPGSSGSSGSGGVGDSVPPGAGGAAGAYITGNSFVTWIALGDVRGIVA